MKKILQSPEPRISSRKPPALTPLGHALPAPEVGLVEDMREPRREVGLTLGQWRRETLLLNARESHWNSWRGVPGGWRFDRLYGQGYSPKDALEAWRDWVPMEEYTPPDDESWPPHDYD